MFLFPAVSDEVKAYPMKPVTSAGGKEFDPLSRQRHPDNTQSKVMSSFGLSNDGVCVCYYYIISHCSNGYRSCLLTAGLLLHGSCICCCHIVVVNRGVMMHRCIAILGPAICVSYRDLCIA